MASSTARATLTEGIAKTAHNQEERSDCRRHRGVNARFPSTSEIT